MVFRELIKIILTTTYMRYVYLDHCFWNLPAYILFYILRHFTNWPDWENIENISKNKIIRMQSKWRVSLRSKFKNKFATHTRRSGCRVLKSTRNLFLHRTLCIQSLLYKTPRWPVLPMKENEFSFSKKVNK